MYESFYGLGIKPFSMMPDPGFLYLSKKHQAALTLLEYGLMNNVGFCVISGETGAGKTTLLRKLLERVDDSYTVGMITNTHQSFGSLLDWVLSAFDQHEINLSQVEKHQKLMSFLIAEYAKNKKVLLIVDEAQNMKADVLEELRMLSNVNSEKDLLMQVVLAGQPALKETLRLPELMQFAQRIGVDYHLSALDVKETCHYIQHRLRTAGAEYDIFTPAACERIYNYSGGTPRLINLLCDTVMVYGFADQSAVIDADLVEEMVHERMKDSLVPLVNRDITAQANQELLIDLEQDFPWIKCDASANDRMETVSAAENIIATDSFSKQPDEALPVTDSEEDNSPSPDEPLSDTVPARETDDKISEDSVHTAKGLPEADTDVSAEKLSQRRPLFNPVEVVVPQTEPASTRHFGLYTIIIGLVLLIVFFLYRADILHVSLLDQQPVESTHNARQIEQANQALEQEKQQLAKQAEILKRERDAALVQVQQEKKRAEKVAARVEAALKAAKLAKQQEAKKLAAVARQREHQRQVQARREKQRVLKRQRLARLAEKKAREEAAVAKKYAAKLARHQRVLEAKLKREQEQRQKQYAAERPQAMPVDSVTHPAVQTETPTADTPEKKTVKIFDDSCSGPAAKFKSTCR